MLGNNEVLKTLTKTLTFVDANAAAYAGGSTIALCERCSGEQIRSGPNPMTETCDREDSFYPGLQE